MSDPTNAWLNGDTQPAQTQQPANADVWLGSNAKPDPRLALGMTPAQIAQENSTSNRIGDAVYGLGMGAADIAHSFGQFVLHNANSVYDATLKPGEKRGVAGQYIHDLSNKFDNHIDNVENQYQADTPNSNAAGLGRLTAGLAPFLMGGEGNSAANYVRPNAMVDSLLNYGKTALQGGAFGITKPAANAQIDNDGNSNYADTKGAQAEIGASGAVLGKYLGGKLSSFVSPTVDSRVQSLIDQGISPSPGQIMGFTETENKLTSLPFVGSKIKAAQNNARLSFNSAALNRGADVNNPYSKLIGQEGVNDALDNYFTPRYNNILGQMSHTPDPQLAQNVMDAAVKNNLNNQGMDELSSFMKKNYMPRFQNSGDGMSPTMNGQAIKDFQAALRLRGDQFSRSTDPYHQDIGAAYDDIGQAFRNSLAKNNPNLAQPLNDLDRQYANFKTYQNASMRAGAANREGAITPSDYIAQIRGDAVKSGNGTQFSKGQAFNQQFANDAKSIIGNDYPDSGTAGRQAVSGGIIPLTVGAVANVPASLLYSDMGQKLPQG
jgi:hypothetical protein